jgi:hypothetical protein
MKWLTAAIFYLLLLPDLFAQSPQKVSLNFMSYAVKLCVTTDESLVLTTRAGEVGITSSFNGDWHRADPVENKMGASILIDQGNFFNKDTGFVSGFISGKDGKYNLIYRTIDGGKSWKAIDFGQEGWVDDATNLSNGEAWLSVAGSGIAYTTDYGLTWQKFNNPEIKQRFSSIFFNNKRQGLVGSLWNLIAYTSDNCKTAYTSDNCKTWKLLPTPLDQKKYSKTNRGSRPELNRVAIFSDYFLVRQEDLVFYSKRDTINWVWLPQYSDFYTDPENTALFFRTINGSFVRANQSLQPIFTSQSVEQPFDAKCRNGSLFLVTGEGVMNVQVDNSVATAYFKNATSEEFAPQSIGYTSKGFYGVQDNKVYIQTDYQGKWKYRFTLPFLADNSTLSIVDEDLLLYDRRDDSLFYYSLSGEEVAKKSKSKMLEDFRSAGISKIVFSRGSQGCFHGYEDQLTYSHQNGTFDGEVEVSSGSKHKETLPEGESEISEGSVADFIQKLPYLFDSTKNASIEDLGFSEQDYEQCKKDILAFQKGIGSKRENKKSGFYFTKNNLDFPRLINLVDSIKHIDNQSLNSILLEGSGMWSTTTNWTQVELINNRGEILSISSRYYEPNAFYFPWMVSLKGYTRTTSSMEINNFVNKVYPGLLAGNSKVEVLHAIVKRFY